MIDEILSIVFLEMEWSQFRQIFVKSHNSWWNPVRALLNLIWAIGPVPTDPHSLGYWDTTFQCQLELFLSIISGTTQIAYIIFRPYLISTSFSNSDSTKYSFLKNHSNLAMKYV